MLTWRLDRLARAGVLCAIGTAGIPLLMAAAISYKSETDNIFGALCVGAFLMLLGTALGSTVVTGVGVALFGAIAAVAEVGPLALSLVGAGLFASITLHDLSASFRRAPAIQREVLTRVLVVTIGLCAVAGSLFALAYFVATRATWQTMAAPVGIVAIGFAARLAADSHIKHLRR